MKSINKTRHFITDLLSNIPRRGGFRTSVWGDWRYIYVVWFGGSPLERWVLVWVGVRVRRCGWIPLYLTLLDFKGVYEAAKESKVIAYRQTWFYLLRHSFCRRVPPFLLSKELLTTYTEQEELNSIPVRVPISYSEIATLSEAARVAWAAKARARPDELISVSPILDTVGESDLSMVSQHNCIGPEAQVARHGRKGISLN